MRTLVPVAISADEREALKLEAKRHGCTVSEYVRSRLGLKQVKRGRPRKPAKTGE